MREAVIILAGLGAGTAAGMGLGGGNLLIPLLTMALGLPQKAAQGVNMLGFIPGAAAALYVHCRAGRVKPGELLWMAAFGAAGAILGAVLGAELQNEIIKKLFGLMLAGLGAAQLAQNRH